MKRGSGCCAVDIYRTAALTSFSNSIKLHNIFIFGMAYNSTLDFYLVLLKLFLNSEIMLVVIVQLLYDVIHQVDY